MITTSLGFEPKLKASETSVLPLHHEVMRAGWCSKPHHLFDPSCLI